MTPELAIDLFKSTVFFALYMVAPFLGIILIVGLITSLLQSVTSIQEQTLAFVPKLIGVGVVVVIVSNWMLKTLMEFTVQMFSRIADMGA